MKTISRAFEIISTIPSIPLIHGTRPVWMIIGSPASRPSCGPRIPAVSRAPGVVTGPGPQHGNPTTSSLTAVDHAAKEQAFSEALLGLGHQIHLLQDTAVPAHVRNDAHPLAYNRGGSPHIEIWAAKNRNTIRQIAANSVAMPGVVTATRCHFQRCQAVPHRPAVRRRPIRRHRSVNQPLAGPGRIHQCQFLQRRYHLHRSAESRRSPCVPLSR